MEKLWEEYSNVVQNFRITLGDLVNISDSLKLKHLHALLRSEALRHFDTLCDQVGITIETHLNQIILGLGT